MSRVPDSWWVRGASQWVMAPILLPFLLWALWSEIEAPQWLADLQGRKLRKKVDDTLERGTGR